MKAKLPLSARPGLVSFSIFISEVSVSRGEIGRKERDEHD